MDFLYRLFTAAAEEAAVDPAAAEAAGELAEVYQQILDLDQ